MKKFSCVVQLMQRVLVEATSLEDAQNKAIDLMVGAYPNFDVFCDRNDITEVKLE